MLISTLRKLLAAAVVGLGIMISHAAAAEELKVTADNGNLGLGFKSEYAEVNGVKLHYVEGGQGQQWTNTSAPTLCRAP